MKKFIYGTSGYGKSYTLIAPILRKESELFYITWNGIRRELEYMELPETILKEIETRDISFNNDKAGIDLSKFPEVMRRVKLLEVADELEKKSITQSARYTIIFSGIPDDFLCSPEFISRIEEWESKVIIDCMCNIEFEAEKIYSYILESSKWEKIPVFHKLY